VVKDDVCVCRIEVDRSGLYDATEDRDIVRAELVYLDGMMGDMRRWNSSDHAIILRSRCMTKALIVRDPCSILDRVHIYSSAKK
jgi:hypothetical protein